MASDIPQWLAPSITPPLVFDHRPDSHATNHHARIWPIRSTGCLLRPGATFPQRRRIGSPNIPAVGFCYGIRRLESSEETGAARMAFTKGPRAQKEKRKKKKIHQNRRRDVTTLHTITHTGHSKTVCIAGASETQGAGSVSKGTCGRLTCARIHRPAPSTAWLRFGSLVRHATPVQD